jgi:hypothetical protein
MDANLQLLLATVCVLAMLAWLAVVLGTAGSLQVVRGRGDAQATVDRARLLARVAWRVGVPAAILVALSGVGYVLVRDLSIAGNWWIGTAIGAWLAAFAGSTISRGAQLSRAVALAGDRGAGDEDVQWRIRREDLTSRGEALLLVVAVAVVVVRPGFG